MKKVLTLGVIRLTEDNAFPWASLEFESEEEIRNLILNLELLIDSEEDHFHVQDDKRNEITFHYPPANKRTWGHYFD